MNTYKMSGEKISALMDGEIDDDQVDHTLAALKKDDIGESWGIYHQIGDVLRSSDMAIDMSSDFNSRFAARLSAEPTLLAPVIAANRDTNSLSPELQIKANPGNSRRWALPGMVAATAMAAVAFVATPQLMVAMQGTPASAEISTPVASTSKDRSGAVESANVTAASASGDVIMRDPRIDDYLFAHQRFSPSLYSTAQYARSATFATESTK